MRGFAEVWGSRIWRRQALAFACLVALALSLFGAMEMVAWYRGSLQQVSALQLAQAHEATQAVRGALDLVDQQVLAVTRLPWSSGQWLTLADRRDEYGRLLRLVPAIQSVAWVAADGQERLFVARDAVDRMASGAAGGAATPPPSGSAPPHLRSAGQVIYRDDYDPVLALRLSFPESPAAGATVVTLGLRALARDLGAALQDTQAQIFVVDDQGVVILHRDARVMLNRTRLQNLPMNAARRSGGEPGTPSLARSLPEQLAVHRAVGLGVADVLRSVVPVDRHGWHTVVERPRALVMAPVWAALQRTALLTLLGSAGSVALALLIASRLTRPIRELHRAALALGEGRLATRLDLAASRELLAVFEQFNQMAQSLQESHAQLEQKVAEKTRDLALANRHMSEFMANMSHELRTPLNAVIGMSEALLDEDDYGVLNDKQREYLGDINQSGEHLLSLINDILDLAKIEAGRAELRPETMAVSEVLANALTLVRERAHRQGVRLDTQIAPEAQTGLADIRRFKQIVVNLLSNAVKFSPMGGEVSLRVGRNAAGLWVEVGDTGCGIAPEHQQLIFQKFGRVAKAGEAVEGTGLGLSLVHELVHLHGGHIEVRSAPGQGSVFRFSIPQPPDGASPQVQA